MTIGGHIAELRKGRGLTQTKLAQMTGINASTLAAYERDRRTPKSEAIASIAKALDVTVKELESSATADFHHEKHSIQDVSESRPNNLTSLSLTREEARLILFTRMNPVCMDFLQKYITSEQRERDQVEKAWKLIHEFQT